MKKLNYFLVPMMFFMFFTMTNYAQVTPEKLAVYYGWPLNVNGQTPQWTAGGTDVSNIINVFDDYDLIVFGQDLEVNLAGADRANFILVVNGLRALNKEVFGYISLGVQSPKDPQPPNLTIAQIRTRVDSWNALGVSGIFLDEAGYDFGFLNDESATRTRQNDAVQYIHGAPRNMNVMMNAWIPDDVLSGTNQLNANDYYMLESFMVSTSSPIGFVPFYRQEVSDRYQSAKQYKDNGNIKVVTVTTTNFEGFQDCQENQLPYAWWSTLAYGFDAMGWGEKNFSSGQHGVGMANQLPYRARPSVNSFPTSLGSFSINDGQITRMTNNGSIIINTKSHTAVCHAGGQKFSFPTYNQTTVEMELCVPQSLGSSQFGIYIKSSNNGLSVCDCYNLPCNNSSLGKQPDGKWYIHGVPDCGMGNHATIDINVGNNCDPTHLKCINNWPN